MMGDHSFVLGNLPPENETVSSLIVHDCEGHHNSFDALAKGHTYCRLSSQSIYFALYLCCATDNLEASVAQWIEHRSSR